MISDNKLKVMLCESDLKHFDIKAEQLDYSNTETKRMFWDILNKAKHQTGFDTDGQRVLVQLYPSKEGGCEMFVTKIGVLCTGSSDECEKLINNHCYTEKNISSPPKSKKIKSHKTLFSVFGFEKTEMMLEVCRRLFSMGYIGESSSYICDNGKKYLFLSDINCNEYQHIDEFSFISEYGQIENHETIKHFISEHGKIICSRDAVATLGKF